MHRSALSLSAMISDMSAGRALDAGGNPVGTRVNPVELVTSVVERTRVLAVART